MRYIHRLVVSHTKPAMSHCSGPAGLIPFGRGWFGEALGKSRSSHSFRHCYPEMAKPKSGVRKLGLCTLGTISSEIKRATFRAGFREPAARVGADEAYRGRHFLRGCFRTVVSTIAPSNVDIAHVVAQTPNCVGVTVGVAMGCTGRLTSKLARIESEGCITPQLSNQDIVHCLWAAKRADESLEGFPPGFASIRLHRNHGVRVIFCLIGPQQKWASGSRTAVSHQPNVNRNR
ncbi:hypothetical protein N657DRAFT_284926 [Parathielavia appendiculata]|uniref:Uncharacterized protein n=1 Tax=Parathielavia appendiculata TaxID=2587402 RepID=A0AAN6Z5G8_9PEZI|nr:hypothetical protein N657DRAFT_284926 [Parathielavia appendiculata]